VPITWEVMDTPMHMNRTLVYAGVFLVALGAALYIVDQRPFATDSIVAVLRAWPLALITIGAALALRRTQIGFASGLLAAAVPGVLLGLTMAMMPRLPITSGPWWDRMEAAYERYHCVDVTGDIQLGTLDITPIGGCK
jgi:hypothetical protein